MKAIIDIKPFLRQRVVQHLGFWVLSFYVLLRIFATDSDVRLVDYIYDGLFHITLVAAVYFNVLVLIPTLLDRQKYLWYLASVVASVGFFSQLNIWFFDVLVDFMLPGFYFISYYEWVDIVQFFAVYLGVSTLLKLSKGWFQLAETKTRLAETRQEKLDAELEALKAQVNPHFLFNSLNNLYGLALKGDRKTPESILKLSEVMRYMIYEAKDDKVPLSKEIIFLENYINLQKLRSGKLADISLGVEGYAEGLEIAPLLFAPFVENSFKHGVKAETGPSYVKVRILVENGSLYFETKNNKGLIDDVEKSRFGGIGLENVKRRLDLIYPSKHELRIVDGENEFTVNLTLQLV